jgi:hypothetical protein
MSIRPALETALAATGERLAPGGGPDLVRQLKNDLSMVDASSDNLSVRFAGVEVALAVPAAFEAKHPDGDPVAVGKRHDGFVAVLGRSAIVVRGLGFGARDIKALEVSELTVEPVALVLDGTEVPGFRFADGRGKPMFAAAVVLPGKQGGDPAASLALREELCALIASS